jgi:hypothetical protein
MKINEILNLNSDSSGKTKLEIVEPPKDIYGRKYESWLEEKCPIAYNSPLKIYRGVRFDSKYNFVYGDSSLTERKSANTQNYYTQIMDNILPEWKQFPKRSRSFICGNTPRICNGYGHIYSVLPIGDPLIGVCPFDDLWSSFRNINMSDFGDWFFNLSEMVGADLQDSENPDVSTIMNIISRLDNNWSELIKNPEKFFGYYFGKCPNLKRFKSFTQFLSWLLNPKRNGFNLVKLSQAKSIANTHEIWFSGPAYFREVDY